MRLGSSNGMYIKAIIYQSYPQVTYMVCIFVYLYLYVTYIRPGPKDCIYVSLFVYINPTPWELEYRVNFFSFDIFMVSRDPGQPGQRAPGCLGHCFFLHPSWLWWDFFHQQHREDVDSIWPLPPCWILRPTAWLEAPPRPPTRVAVGSGLVRWYDGRWILK